MTKLPDRRHFVHLAAGTVALTAVSRIARAQGYPTRPVRIMVGFAPGGGTDIMARLLGHWLSERLGQPFIVENRPGAGTNIATEVVVNALADGYTLLEASLPNASNAALYPSLKFNFLRDITPIAGATREAFLIEVNPTLPVHTVPEFIDYARANPSKLNMASAGIGSGNHLFGELFKLETGIELAHVKYRGGGSALLGRSSWQQRERFALPQLGPRCARARSRSTGRCRRGSRPRSSLRRRPRRRLQRRGLGKPCRRYV